MMQYSRYINDVLQGWIPDTACREHPYTIADGAGLSYITYKRIDEWAAEGDGVAVGWLGVYYTTGDFMIRLFLIDESNYVEYLTAPSKVLNEVALAWKNNERSIL